MNILKSTSLTCSLLLILPLSLNLYAKELTETELQKILLDAFKNKGVDYQPRTRHFNKAGQPEFINRLILEDSPYLLQHAHNPVNWFPWGEEAFARALAENKPVFLSIGYSTCHWCHVMEKESFEDVEIAKFLNEHFISVKVDRERRPEVDELYMTALMLVKGQGGWPMSNFLLHDGLPFLTETYMPPDKFLKLLMEVNQAWTQKHDEIVKYAEILGDAVKITVQPDSNKEVLDEDIILRAVDNILKNYDSVHGGFGRAQKFPNESLLFLLLQVLQRQDHAGALTAIEHTLNKMAHGGYFDQVGGGFHRYSTDVGWLVPHFEKMLYNQANLARIYIQAYQLTGKQYYEQIATQTLDYVLRDMTSPAGVFYSASDADSNGREGAYYLWTLTELKNILTPQDVQFVMRIYNVTDEGNFEGANILHLPNSLVDTAHQLNMSVDSLLVKIDSIRAILHTSRKQRKAPVQDEKVIVAWNAMMISALSETYRVQGDPEYLDSARRAAEYIWNQQRRPDGSLWRVNMQGRPSIPAMQEDYAYFIEAMLELYDVTGDLKWLDRAQTLSGIMSSKFWDKVNGGFFMSEQNKSLFKIPKQSMDTTIPSGNSVAVQVLSQLSHRTNDVRYANKARQIIQNFSGTISQYPGSYAYMLKGWDTLLHGEAGPLDYAANGAIKISATLEKNLLLTVTLDIAAGWHINTHKPLQDYLIPLNLELINHTDLWRLENIQFPEPVYKTLGFDEGKLALYEGVIEIRADLVSFIKHTKMQNRRIDLQLQIQACSDEICLPPEIVNLEVTTK